MKKTFLFNNLYELNLWERNIIDDFILFYKDYENQFLKYSIQLMIKPCFCHNKTQRYYTKKNTSGSFMAFRIQLYPVGKTFNEAKKEFLVKEFISHKVLSYKKVGEKIQVKLFQMKDICLIIFLNRYLKKAKWYASHNKVPYKAIKENLFDILRPLTYALRYRAEIKMSYRGVNLELYFVILIAILILIACHTHYKAQHPLI